MGSQAVRSGCMRYQRRRLQTPLMEVQIDSSSLYTTRMSGAASDEIILTTCIPRDRDAAIRRFTLLVALC